MVQESRKIYQLKVTLKQTKPPIWRRVLVLNRTPLADLHEILQTLMGWTDSHLHQFIVEGQYYGAPSPYDDFMEMADERQYRLDQLLKKEKASMIYEYDFGDGWNHKITLEKILPFDQAQRLPQCLKGKGACPPEDVGGVWGYYAFLDALANPEHPEHDELKEWIGGDFDPDELDLDDINSRLFFQQMDSAQV
ncbi:plasmid pRiA4b ORF-3 family protein [Halochromatium roseum]|uniref:plasmid pRiA4b ORF-3 family protein n=1 Tax=Halochromatium roseum TaxID=391920 RepID=UPI001911C5B0|nr:plasmid pRiA4b ORF-3 family protein [Halochromatium roseum]MBK5942076.1 hypothetical protein [Halochromatium roseum]